MTDLSSFEKRAYVHDGGAVRAAFEVRDDPSTGAPTLHGYASLFNEEYDMGMFRERVLPGAFTRTLANNPDVRLLVDHQGQPLARTKSGTLQLAEDERGLRVQATLDPSDPDVQRLLPKMRRGDLDQMSFAFRVAQGGDSWSDDYSQRSLKELILSGGDVSVVTYPASPSTEASIRARDEDEGRRAFADAVYREIRAGKAISAANMAKLQAVLRSLADIDTALDTADQAIDAAQAQMSEVLGVPNPDPDEGAGRSRRPLGLAQAIATRLSVAGN